MIKETDMELVPSFERASITMTSSNFLSLTALLIGWFIC